MQQRRAGIAGEHDRRACVVTKKRSHPFLIESGSYRYCVNVIRAEKLRCFQQRGEDTRNLRPATAGKQCYPWTAHVKFVFGGKLLARDGRCGQIGQRVSDELRFDATLAVKLLLEGKNHEHLANVLPNEFDASLFPRPELRADVVNDRHTKPV